MTTARDATCPTCGTEKSTAFVALIPRRDIKTGADIPAYRYSVCRDCYLKQYEMVYPGVRCPILYDPPIGSAEIRWSMGEIPPSKSHRRPPEPRVHKDEVNGSSASATPKAKKSRKKGKAKEPVKLSDRRQPT